MHCLWLVLGVVGLAGASVSLAHLEPEDVVSLSAVFARAVKEAKDPAPAHFGAAGLALLQLPITEKAAACELAKSSVDKTSLESVYHASSLAKAAGCQISIPEAPALINSALTEAKPVAQNLYFAAVAAQNLGIKTDNAKLTQAVQTSVKEDDSVQNLGYALHAASLLSGDLSSFASRIEDMVAQADEVDSKYLQYEGGLSVTAIAVSGIYTLADKTGKAPGIKADEAVKFANYLLSRRGVQMARPAYHLLNALSVLTSNKFHVPVSVYLASNVAVSSVVGDVTVGVVNVLGKPVGPLTLTLDSATHVPSSGVVLSKKPMSPATGDKTKTQYSLNLVSAAKEKGFYKLSISAASSTDKRLVGTQGASVSVKVMGEMKVEDVELSIMDRDVSTGGQNVKLTPGKKHSGSLDANSHQKVIMKFAVKDKTSSTPLAVHQAFVLFTHKETGQEIVFVAEPAKDKSYKFDVDLGKSAKDFDNLGGAYEMSLIVGDAILHNPLNWNLATVNINFPSVEKAKKPRHEEVFWEPRPEIKHMFRVPEKRPPQFLSDIFTIACLCPALILLLLWLRIGINFGNFPLSLWPIIFHLGLGGILGCYWLFWVKLNMFTTLKYVAMVGSVTFLAGNRMLRSMAQQRK